MPMNSYTTFEERFNVKWPTVEIKVRKIVMLFESWDLSTTTEI